MADPVTKGGDRHPGRWYDCFTCSFHGPDGPGHTAETGHATVLMPRYGDDTDCPHGEPRGSRYCAFCRAAAAAPPPPDPGFVQGRDDPADRHRQDTIPAARRDVDSPGTLVASTDGPVQRSGARAALPNSGTRRRRLYEALLAAPDGLTFSEASRDLGWDYSATGPRMRELVRDGFAVDSGRTRPSIWTDATQVVWEAREVR